MTSPLISTLLILALIGPAPVSALEASPGGAPPNDAPPQALLERVREVRRVFASGAVDPAEDSWQRIELRGRPALEVKGRVRGADGALHLRDLAVVDLATGRVASFVWFPGASRRRAGEAILPMSEASIAADARIGALLPRTALAFVGIQRYRASGEESVYYEVGYSPEGEVRHPEPLVRLILDASSGSPFRFDVDPAWFDPLPAGGRLASAAARRIAGVLLRPPALEGAFGPGARAGRLSVEGLYFVRPNGWPASLQEEPSEAPRRLAWGISFTVEGGSSPGPGMLFVDARTGRGVGGGAGPPP